MERFLPSKPSRIEPLNLVGTARCAVRAAFSGATMPPADSRAGTSQRDVPTEVRFMERIPPSKSSRIEPLNRSSRRKEALDLPEPKKLEPPYVGCYERTAHGEGDWEKRPVNSEKC